MTLQRIAEPKQVEVHPERSRSRRISRNNLASFTFVCGDCGREQVQPDKTLPLGWDLVEKDCSGLDFVRCPDCLEAIEQRYRQAFPLKIAETSSCVMSAAMMENYAVIAARPMPFHIFLERQADGTHHIALHPESVLMRWLPLGFFLDPAAARQTAAELTRYADLAENPGQLPATMGAGR